MEHGAGGEGEGGVRPGLGGGAEGTESCGARREEEETGMEPGKGGSCGGRGRGGGEGGGGGRGCVPHPGDLPRAPPPDPAWLPPSPGRPPRAGGDRLPSFPAPSTTPCLRR